jgi:hypothetical protein
MPTSWKILDLPDLRLRTPYTVLPRPNAIDKWLSGNYVTSPGNVFALGYRYMGDLLSDQVLCTLQLSTTVVRYFVHSIYALSDVSMQVHCDDFFTDIIKYRLALYVEVPETSAVDVTDLISPIATLGCYEGLCSDADAPDWTRMPPGKPVELRQPRDAMVDVFTEIAFWPENANIVCFMSYLMFLPLLIIFSLIFQYSHICLRRSLTGLREFR